MIPPWNFIPVVRRSTSWVFLIRRGSSLSRERSSCRLPAVAAHGVMMSAPRDSAMAKFLAFRVI